MPIPNTNKTLQDLRDETDEAYATYIAEKNRTTTTQARVWDLWEDYVKKANRLQRAEKSAQKASS